MVMQDLREKMGMGSVAKEGFIKGLSSALNLNMEWGFF